MYSFEANFHYLLSLTKLYLRHRVLPRPRGLELRKQIVSLVHDEYSLNPVEEKHAFGLEICLNREDWMLASSIARLGCWDLGGTKLFLKVLRRGDLVVDIGANIGWFTLLSSKIVGKEGIVISFEPNPSSFQYLKRSIEKNNLNQVRAFSEAISNFDGVSTLQMSPMPGQDSLARNYGGQNISVQCRKLDTVAQDMDIAKIDLLKVDVEGAEPDVILGAKRLLDERRIKRIYMEWNPEAWEHRSDVLGNLFQLFEIKVVAGFFPRLKFRSVTQDSMPSSDENLYLRSKDG